jgi:hypothetical protein
MLAQQPFIWIRQLMVNTLQDFYAGRKLNLLEDKNERTMG